VEFSGKLAHDKLGVLRLNGLRLFAELIRPKQVRSPCSRRISHVVRCSNRCSLFHFGLAAQLPPVSPSPDVAKVAAGAGRFNNVIKLPGGDLVYMRVASQDSGGALFMTEQPIERRGVGPPKHYHEVQDEWFYCLGG
jgi:hypothetical protein